MAFNVYHATYKNGKLNDRTAQYRVVDASGVTAAAADMTSTTVTGLYYASLDPSGWTRSTDGLYLVQTADKSKGFSNVSKSKFLEVQVVDEEIVGINNSDLIDTLTANVGTPTDTDIATDIANVQTDTTAILEDTGTTLDGKIDTIDTNVDAVLVDTGTTIPGILGTAADTDLATDLVNIQAQADKLDSAAMTAPSSVTNNSFADYLFNKDGSQTYDQSTDSLEAIRDQGDSSWGASSVAHYTIMVKANGEASTPIISITALKNGQELTSSSLSLTITERVIGSSATTVGTISESSPNAGNTYDVALGFTPTSGKIYMLSGTCTIDGGSRNVVDGFVAY